MIVVADTSPVNYLLLIGEIQLLRQLYQQVSIPDAVLAELRHPSSPPQILEWTRVVPEWLRVVRLEMPVEPGLEALDAGERQAILLAQAHYPNSLLLIDEERGRAEALRRSLRMTGTLGVLNDAASRKLVHLPTALARLRNTSFRARPRLFQALLELDAKRRERPAE